MLGIKISLFVKIILLPTLIRNTTVASSLVEKVLGNLESPRREALALEVPKSCF